MVLKRKKVRKTEPTAYPTLAEAGKDRRAFLKILGRGMIAVPVLGLARCNLGSSNVTKDAADDAAAEPDWQTMGVAPIDVRDPPPDPDVTDAGTDSMRYELGGVAPREVQYDPDIKEVENLAGDMPDPDVISKPDTCSNADAGGFEDIPVPGGIMEPDIIADPDTGSGELDGKGEVDAEFPPLDGDMEEPGF